MNPLHRAQCDPSHTCDAAGLRALGARIRLTRSVIAGEVRGAETLSW
jgi:hypothetical protein